MQRTFLIAIDLDPAEDINQVVKELIDTIQYEFPELISVKPWSGHDEPSPLPVEGANFLGQTSASPA